MGDDDSGGISRRRFLSALGIGAAAGVGATAAGVPLLATSMTPLRRRAHATPTDLALRDIPPELLPLFLTAGDRYEFPWNILAAVAWRESSWSPELIACQRHSKAGAQGLMQFMPGTARGLGIDPCDVTQAIPAAALYLRGHLQRFGSYPLALAAYNAGGGAVARHGGIPPFPETQAYVPAVLGRAAQYAEAYATDSGGLANITGDPETVIALAGQGRIRLTQRAINDLRHPAMDGRVIAAMEALAEQHNFAVSVIKTGHSRCVGGGDYAGCRESHHYQYRAVDIYAFDGELVGTTSAVARAVVQWFAGLQGQLRPSEVGSPFRVDSPGHFSDAGHQGHIHIGWAPTTKDTA